MTRTRSFRGPMALAILALAAIASAQSGSVGPTDSGSSFVPGDGRLHLRHFGFDPLLGSPELPSVLRQEAGRALVIVQLDRALGPAERRGLVAAGAGIRHYLPFFAHVCELAPGARDAVKALPFVRWVGGWHPAYRVDEATRLALVAGDGSTRWYQLWVTQAGASAKAGVAAALAGLGARVQPPSPHGHLLVAELASDQLLQVLHRDDVLFVDRWSPATPDLAFVRGFYGVDQLETVAGFTGAGVRGEVSDRGFRPSHQDFAATPPLLHGPIIGAMSHGTATYGILFGDGSGNPAARGLLPDAQGIMADRDLWPDRFAHTAELLQPAYEAVFQSNSWGTGPSFFYGTTSADLDFIAFHLDFAMLHSHGNFGSQDARPESWAKNVISVGGVQHLGTADPTDDLWGGGASIGPAFDGRVKPDLVAAYDGLMTTDSVTDSSYQSFAGTSAACPVTAGHLGLIAQMWSAGLFGNPAMVGGSVFQNRPHLATLKALLINSAIAYPFSGPGDDLARSHQGWGRPSALQAWTLAPRSFVVDESDVLGPFETRAWSLTVGPGDPQFAATLVINDAPGNPAAAVARVNDLDLRVIDPAGHVYWGNHGLTQGNVSLGGGGPDVVDPVERVVVPAPVPGVWRVEVTVRELNTDGHLETPAIDADYGLVVTGVDPLPLSFPAGTGQANQLAASLTIPHATSAAGMPPSVGVPGPFVARLGSGQSLGLRVSGSPQTPFLLLAGPLNPGNADFGVTGSLDIGLGGATGDFSDVMVLLDGVSPVNLLDLLANTGSGGQRTVSFTLPTLPPQILAAFQVVLADLPGQTLRLSAATEVRIL